MEERVSSEFENLIRRRAAQMRYPATPDIAASISAHNVERSAYRKPILIRTAFQTTLVAIVLLLASLLVPGVRAAVLEFLQIGSVRIQLATPRPSPAASTPGPSATPYPSLFSSLDLSGETTLQDAQAQASFAIRLPTYPPDLGQPDRVFLQDQNGDLLILIWLDPQDNGRAALSLIEMDPNAFISKGSPVTITETSVNGVPAVWLKGEHYLLLEGERGGLGVNITVRGNVLIWEQDGITFRLESSLSLEESLVVAESISDMP